MRKTIRGQILFGYLVLLIIPVLMTLITVAYLWIISIDLSIVTDNRANQNATKDAIVGHYSWIMQLGDTINEGIEFSGSLDPNTCGLGKWISSVSSKDLEYPEISTAIDDIKIPHEYIHTQATNIIQLNKTDNKAAYEEYSSVIKPKVNNIIEDISIITNKYKQIADKNSEKLKNNIGLLIKTCIGLIVIAVLLSLKVGFNISKRISTPVKTIADWSSKLALGCNTLDFNEIDISKLSAGNEISIMIESYRAMAKNLQNNIQVIKRVADGDLTAYVEIRSSEDVLGQHLYRMVQSSDLMFADILNVSSTVAVNADQISNISHSIAASATEQATSVEQLSSTVIKVNNLAIQNTEKVNKVLNTFDYIKNDIKHSSEQMKTLVTAVGDIRKASDRISTVIKSIEDISFQTNILALNASIEAARAGSAGNGFAVVAEEVRQLSLKSSIASEETREIIENTISKTHYGEQVADETSKIFEKIISSIIETSEIVEKIASASKEQENEINSVHSGITQISAISESNAASCEESSASSDEMYHSAEILRLQMNKFNLRQRQYGKPYIPKEKQNDPEFIAIATENYKKALENDLVNENRLLKLTDISKKH